MLCVLTLTQLQTVGCFGDGGGQWCHSTLRIRTQHNWRSEAVHDVWNWNSLARLAFDYLNPTSWILDFLFFVASLSLSVLPSLHSQDWVLTVRQQSSTGCQCGVSVQLRKSHRASSRQVEEATVLRLLFICGSAFYSIGDKYNHCSPHGHQFVYNVNEKRGFATTEKRPLKGAGNVKGMHERQQNRERHLSNLWWRWDERKDH